MHKIKVKFLSRPKLPNLNIGDSFLRRFENRIPIVGNCEFIFDDKCRNYDWLAVYDDLPRGEPVETLACPQENTILLTGEPSSITRYGKRFLQQFGHILSSQEPAKISHHNLISKQTGLFWFYGGSDARGTFDSLIKTPPIGKSQTISTVCSTKAMRHTLHFSRLQFVRRLMETELPEIDVWGHGMKELQNKADAIDPYKYHLTIENHSCDHHWTEKLADAYLGYALPIYFGCTNLHEYFPEESFILFDLKNPSEALDIIRKTLRDDPYEKRLSAIIEARRRVIHEYATFPQLARIIEQRHKPGPARPTVGPTLYGRRKFRKKAMISALFDIVDSALS